MHKIGISDIADIKLGTVNINKVMLGASYVIWERGGGQTPCFEVVSSISSATGEYVDVYCTADSKWYKKNNLNAYEEYGIYEQVSSLSSATYYVGKLVILTTDNHEYEWTGSEWEDLGMAGIIVHSPEYISRTSSATGYVGLGQKFQSDTVVEVDFQMTNDRGYAVVGDYWGNDNDDWRFFINYSNGGYRGINYDFDTTRIQTQVSNTKARFHFDIGNYYVKNHGASSNLITGTTKTNVERPNQMYLFHMEGQISQVNEDYGNVYMIKITNGGILVKDFIPWTDLNGNYGLFDRVTNTVHQSTGQLTGSSNVTDIVISQPPVEYDTKVAPADYVSYSTLEELKLMECPWVGMHAYVGGELYIYTSDLQWEYVDIPYGDRYLTFKTKGAGTFTLTIPSAVDEYVLTSISYSTDNGQTWVTTENTSSMVTITTPTIPANSTVLWKGTGTRLGTSSSNYSYFTATGNFDVYGNIMSLLYGDNFSGQTKVFNYCFNYLFKQNTYLLSASNLILPATTLEHGCYENMFHGCSSLTTAPVLPATTLAIFCYDSMFQGCASLTTAPELPATTLANECYNGMFQGCTSLTSAPELPATTLVHSCYSNLFTDCTNLNYIKCLATSGTTVVSYLLSWVYNVAATGTFVKDAKTRWTTGDDGIPYGWTVENEGVPWEGEYLTIASTSDNNTIGWKASNSSLLKTISVSTDSGQTWTNVTSSTGGATLATLNNGDKLLIKGTNAAYADNSNNNKFTSTGSFDVEGNIMSMIYGDNFSGQTALTEINTFRSLFDSCTHLVSAANLKLPATTLVSNCYRSMFYSCSGLTTAPELPATTLVYGCYYYMFRYCSSLTTAPVLPATTLVDSCYYSMFQDCTSLTTAPALPATTLAVNCYRSMFYSCSSLTTAPELPATTLATYCYYYMFRYCTSLTTAPELPATTLVSNCYRYMFQNCTNLNYIKCLATNMSASNCINNWVSSVSSTGTFVKDANTSWTTGSSGIPTGWSVQDA